MSAGHGGRRRAKKHEEEEHENHERWMVSYADMMTLLLVLFVVLYAMSQVDKEKFAQLASGLSDAFGTPVSVTVLIVAGLAAAKTSAGAPWLIWVASVELAPKLKVTLAPDLAWKSWPMWVKTSVSEAAAKTVIGAAETGDPTPGGPAGLPGSAPQALPRISRELAMTTTGAGNRAAIIIRSPEPRPRHGSTSPTPRPARPAGA